MWTRRAGQQLHGRNGQWSVTSEKADRTMTPAKTKVVMDFLAWLFTPQHLGHWLEINQGGGDIPTEPAAPTATVPGLKGLLPSGKGAGRRSPRDRRPPHVGVVDARSSSYARVHCRHPQLFEFRFSMAVGADHCGTDMGDGQPRQPAEVQVAGTRAGRTARLTPTRRGSTNSRRPSAACLGESVLVVWRWPPSSCQACS